jgi:hypothetical protein
LTLFGSLGRHIVQIKSLRENYQLDDNLKGT